MEAAEGYVVLQPIKMASKGGRSIVGFKSKLIFLLIVYFAGFATAIYCLAPAPDDCVYQSNQKGFAYSGLKSGEFVQSFNAGMHKCIDFARDTACRAGRIIKQKFEDRNDSAG